MKIMILAIFALSLELLVGQTGLVRFGVRDYDPRLDLSRRRHESVYAAGIK